MEGAVNVCTTGEGRGKAARWWLNIGADSSLKSARVKNCLRKAILRT